MVAERPAFLGVLLVPVLVYEPLGVERIRVGIGLRIAMDGPRGTVNQEL